MLLQIHTLLPITARRSIHLKLMTGDGFTTTGHVVALGDKQGGFGNGTSRSGFGSSPNTGNSNSQTSGNASSSRRYTTTTGDVIEDRRTEDEINRRIFTQDEGEYVDFEEVE